MLCTHSLNPVPQLAALILRCCHNSAVLSSVPEQIGKVPFEVKDRVNLVPYCHPIMSEYGGRQLTVNQNGLSVHQENSLSSRNTTMPSFGTIPIRLSLMVLMHKSSPERAD